MTDQTPLRLPLDASRWLNDQPEHAPASLLAHVLTRTAASRQRAAVVAAALGTPTMDASRPTTWRLQLALLAVVAVVGLAAAAVLAGAARQDAPIVAPTSGPTLQPTVVPTPTRTPEGSLAPHSVTGVGTIGNIEIAIPAGWRAVRDGPALRILQDANNSFFSIQQEVTALDPGDELHIDRPSGESSNLSFQISGATFDALVASIDRGLGDGQRTIITIGGSVGYRWAVPLRWYVGPLAGLAAFEWRGRFYVFQVHYPLDGAPGDVLGPVLAGVNLR